MVKSKKGFIVYRTNITDNIIIASIKKESPFIGESILFYDNDFQYVECEGCVFEILNNKIKILLTKGNQYSLFIGDIMFRTYKNLYLPLDFNTNFFSLEYKEINSDSPNIISRKKVSKPLFTGVNVIVCLIPVGFGQRQLIIGDNNTGKTSLDVR